MHIVIITTPDDNPHHIFIGPLLLSISIFKVGKRLKYRLPIIIILSLKVGPWSVVGVVHI